MACLIWELIKNVTTQLNIQEDTPEMRQYYCKKCFIFFVAAMYRLLVLASNLGVYVYQAANCANEAATKNITRYRKFARKA